MAVIQSVEVLFQPSQSMVLRKVDFVIGYHVPLVAVFQLYALWIILHGICLSLNVIGRFPVRVQRWCAGSDETRNTSCISDAR